MDIIITIAYQPNLIKFLIFEFFCYVLSFLFPLKINRDFYLSSIKFILKIMLLEIFSKLMHLN